MIYTTGTIAGNGSTITGTGTNFTAAGSLIRAGCTLITFTNPVQVLQLTAVTSGAALSVTPAITPAIAAGTKYAILLSDSLSVDGLAQDIAETFGMYQKYMGGFSDVMNGTGDVTITINGQAVTVPGQKSVAKKGANTDITSLGGLTTALSVGQGGTGGKTQAAARQGIGITDAQLNSIGGKSGGAITGVVSIDSTVFNLRASDPDGGWAFLINFMAGQGNNITYARIGQQSAGNIVLATGVNATPKYFSFDASGGFTAPGSITCVSLAQTSDRDKKDKITNIENALDKIDAIRGVTYELKASGLPSAGVIAQELMEVLPEAVGSVFEDHDVYEEVEEEVQNEVVGEDGEKTFITETIKVNKLLRKRDESQRSYTVEYAGVVALCVQAIKELRQEVETLKNLHNA